MTTLMNASAARKESEINIKIAAIRQLEKIENMINKAVHAGEFSIALKEGIYEDNELQLTALGYNVNLNYKNKEDWCWIISWY